MITNANITKSIQTFWKKPYYEIYINWEEVSRELITLDLKSSIWDSQNVLTMDTLELQMKNLKQLGSKYNFVNVYWQDVILKLWYKNNDWTFDVVTKFKWKIYDSTDNDYLVTLTLYSLYDLRTDLTLPWLYTNIIPRNLLQIIFNHLGYNLEIITKDNSDENWKLINVIWFYKENLFEVLQNLIEFSQWKLVYKYNDNKFVYYTWEYLNDKIQNWYRDVYYAWDAAEWTKFILLNSTINHSTNELVNDLKIERYIYKKKLNESIHTFDTDLTWLEAWQSITLTKKFDKNYIESYNIWEKNWYTNDNNTWDNYNWASWLPDKIWITIIDSWPNHYSIKITNNHTSKLYIDIELLWNWFFYTTENLNFNDIASNSKYWRHKKDISNSFFQNKNYCELYWNQYIDNNKEVSTNVSFKCSWNPLLELLDKVKINNSLKARKKFEGLIEQIDYTFDLENKFVTTIYLKNAKYIEAITPIIDDISADIINWNLDSNTVLNSNPFSLTIVSQELGYNLDKLISTSTFYNWDGWTYDNNTLNMNWQLYVKTNNLSWNYNWDKLISTSTFYNWKDWTYDNNTLNINWQLYVKTI